MGATHERSSSRWVCSVKSVAIIGPNGQLGSDLVKIFRAADWQVTPLSHLEIQVENLDSVKKSLIQVRPDWVINTAAFHKVDECEKNPEKSWLINGLGPQNIAQVASELKSNVVFISSDYVFSGDIPIGSSYREDNLVSPINVYGNSKAAGEAATLAASKNNIVIRISSVFGRAGSSGKGGNFVETIIKKAKNGDALNVVSDIHMSPTYTVDASKIILESLKSNFCGILHAANSGSATWFEFAREILKQTKLDTTLSESLSDWELSPKKPRNSTLDVEKALGILNVENMWPLALKRYLKEKGHL